MKYVYVVMYGFDHEGDTIYAVYDTKKEALEVKENLDIGDFQTVLECKINEPIGDPFYMRIEV